MEIIIAALILGVMGLVFGLVLTATSKIFEVPSDPKRDAVREALPGANCGGCGFPGCDGCADAIASGKAPVNACPVASEEANAKIAEAMGVAPADNAVKMVAHVICQGDIEHCRSKFNYTGIQDCVAASTVADGNRSCKYACLGLGTCVKACPFGAISIDERLKIAVVDEEKCKSCGKCVAACPKGVLDMAKCVGCMMCAEVCPTHAIKGDWDNRKIANIKKDDCIGCGLCKRQCQFEAIVGEIKKPHEILEACTGCGKCAEKCPKKCISMKTRDHVRDNFAKVGTTPDQVLAVEAPKA